MNRYITYRSDIKAGDVLEFSSHSFLGWAIRKKTKKDVNHTSMVMRFTQYDTQRIFLLEALAHGIVLNLLSRRLLNFEGEVYLLRLKPEFDSYRKRIVRLALHHVGVGYDYGSIVKQFFGRVSTDLNKLFCSEFVYATLKDAKIVPDLPTAPRPGEMCDLGCFQERVRIL